MMKREEAILRQLRMYFRSVVHRLARNIKYRIFATSGRYTAFLWSSTGRRRLIIARLVFLLQTTTT